MYQRRPLCFGELVALKTHAALVGSTLRPFESLLQSLCFMDNERGDAVDLSLIYATRVIRPANDRLIRNGKPVRIGSLAANHQRHHALDVIYLVDGVRHYLSISLFAPSKKTLAAERSGDTDNTTEYSPPRRGQKIKRG